jgi:hypothetical protein
LWRLKEAIVKTNFKKKTALIRKGKQSGRSTLIDFDRYMPKDTNKEKALAALIETSSIREAAKVSGMGEATFYRYLQDREFLTEYRTLRRTMIENAISQFQQTASEAIRTLKDNLHCENPAIAVRASQIILEFAFKGLETTDILERLEKIEDEIQ